MGYKRQLHRDLQRNFDRVETPSGCIYVPKRPSLRLLGKPPWTIEMGDDASTSIVPDEALDLIGAVVWRGIRFVREEGK